MSLLLLLQISMIPIFRFGIVALYSVLDWVYLGVVRMCLISETVDFVMLAIDASDIRSD